MVGHKNFNNISILIKRYCRNNFVCGVPWKIPHFCCPCEARHPKTGLKIFVIVISKEELAGTRPAKLSIWYNTNYRVILWFSEAMVSWLPTDHSLTNFILFLVSYQKKPWLGLCHPSLFLVWQWQRSKGLFLHDTAHVQKLWLKFATNHNHCDAM